MCGAFKQEQAMDRQTYHPADSPVQTRSSRSLARRTAIWTVLCLTLGLLPGCQIIIGVLAMVQGLNTQDADFKAYSRESLPKSNKKVAVLCWTPNSARTQYGGLDADIINEVTRRLRQAEIDVVAPYKISKFLDDNTTELKNLPAAELCKKFKADYLILIEINSLSFFEENSKDLYRGTATGRVSTVKATKDGKDLKVSVIYNHPISSKYPIHQPIPAEQRDHDVFCREFVARLSEEIARLFYDHRPGEDI